MRIVFCILFCFFTATLFAAAQDSTAVQFDDAPLQLKKITKEDIQSYKEDVDYNYTIVKSELTWWEDLKNWGYNLMNRIFAWIFGAGKAEGYLAVFLKALPYVLLGVLVFILIKFFLKVNSRRLANSNANENTVSLSEEEHIIKNEDIQELIKKALQEGNYRLAVRYYYLHILKLLSERELIAWELQKTNDDYQKELEKSAFSEHFDTITRLYDYVWYGGFTIDETKYNKAAIEFTTLQKNITKSD